MAQKRAAAHAPHEAAHFPDLSDGLTEIQRRILAALAKKTAPGHRTVRSDLVLKLVLGGPVPSLEAALTGAAAHRQIAEPGLTTYLQLVQMAQTFHTRYPLVDWVGSFGTADGGPPPDHVFTRCGLSRFGAAVAAGIAPHLLVNGAGAPGAESGYFLPHHLGEVLTAAAALIQDPTLPDEALVSSIPGPDLPTGGAIPYTPAVRRIYLTGEGTLPVRARVEVGQTGEGLAAVVDGIPGWTSRSQLEAEVADGMRSGVLRCTSGMVVETDERGPVRLQFPIRSGATPEAVLAEVFAHTSLETEIRVDMRALDCGALRRVSLPAMLRAYVRQITRASTALDASEATAERLLAELAALRAQHEDPRRTQLGRSWRASLA